MEIRNAQSADLERILEIYAAARRYMAEHGNQSQWGTQNPQKKVIEADIRKQQSFVIAGENGRLHGVFAFMFGEDPTYRQIEGAWLNEEPYAVIHRLASDGTESGIFGKCLEFCRKQCGNLRIDTHADNRKMQELLEKNGFQKCGIIHVADGTERIAYQLTEKMEFE